MAALRCHVWCRGLRAQRLARLTRPCSVLKAAWETLNLAPALAARGSAVKVVAWLQFVIGVSLVSPASESRWECCHMHSCVSICSAVSVWEVGYICQWDLHTRSAPATQGSCWGHLLASCNSCSVHAGGMVTQGSFGPCSIVSRSCLSCGGFLCSYHEQ